MEARIALIDSENLSITDPTESAQRCRICLEPGLIPIFGSSKEPDISTAVKTFGDIAIYNGDQLPKYLCDSCHELLQGAIIFRNNAQQSDGILRNYKCGTPKSLNNENEYNNCNKVLAIKKSNVDCELNDFDENDTEIGGDKNRNNDNEMIMIIVSDDNNESKLINESKSAIDYQHTNTMYHKNTKYRFHKVKCKVCNKIISKQYFKRHQEKHSIYDENLIETELNDCSPDLNTLDEKDSSDCKSNDETDTIEVPNKIKCRICKKIINKLFYNKHLKSHNVTAPRQRQCPICEKNVSCTYFKHHMSRIHDTEIQNLTEDNNDITEKKCNNKKPKTYKQYVCDKCGKVFKRPTTFKLHSLTHTNELKYKCMFCPYKGLHQALLKIHVRTHTGDYNYKCTKCPAKFTTKSNMNKHLQRHRGPIDFKCDKCKRGFYSKLELERHDKVDHLGIKNHICNICGLAFGYRNGMMNHQLKVHKREKLTKGKGRRPNYLVVESEEAA